MIKMCCGRKTREQAPLLCLDIIHLQTCLRLHPCLPDGLFPLIARNCQSYPSLCDLLTILCRAQDYKSARWLQKLEMTNEKTSFSLTLTYFGAIPSFTQCLSKMKCVRGEMYKTSYPDTDTQWFRIVHCTGTEKLIDSNYTKHVSSKRVLQSWQPFAIDVKVVVVRDNMGYKE